MFFHSLVVFKALLTEGEAVRTEGIEPTPVS
jgi:hypothetical protein